MQKGKKEEEKNICNKQKLRLYSQNIDPLMIHPPNQLSMSPFPFPSTVRLSECTLPCKEDSLHVRSRLMIIHRINYPYLHSRLRLDFPNAHFSAGTMHCMSRDSSLSWVDNASHGRRGLTSRS